MIDGTYLLEVDTPLGRKSGMATLTTNGDVLEASVEAPIIGKQEATGTVDGNEFSAQGAIKIPFKGKLNYTLKGTVAEDGMVNAQLHTGKGDFTIVGARL